MKISAGILVLVISSVLLARAYFSAGTRKAAISAVNTPSRKNTDLLNSKMIDTAVSLLCSGDIVLRSGIGADSYLLASFNRKDKTYSHCGIVMIENGYPFVYHSIGGEDNPDERMRRDSASFFFSSRHNTAIAVVRYDYGAAGSARLKHVVKAMYLLRPKFDLKFDLKTDDELYCAEMVYKAVNKATGDSSYIRTTTVLGRKIVGIDDLFINPHAHIVWQTKFKQYLCPTK